MPGAIRFASLVAELKGDMTHLTSTLGRARTDLQRLGGVMTSVARIGETMFVAMAGSAAFGFGYAINKAANLRESINKTQVAFGASAGKLTDFAERMADAFGTPKQAMLDGAASIGMIGEAAGLSQSAAADMATSLAEVAIDASSLHNVSLAEALEKIRAGLVGQIRPLREMGVLLSAAATKAEAFRLGLTMPGGALTEQAKVLARISLIKSGLASAKGDQARTLGDPKSAQRAAAGRMENLSSDVGTTLMPAWSAFLGIIGEVEQTLARFFTRNKVDIGIWVQQLTGRIEDARVGFWNLVGNVQGVAVQVGAALGRIRDFLAPLVSAWVNNVRVMISAWGTFLGGLDDKGITGGIGAALTFVRDALVAFYDVSARIGPQVLTALTPIGAVFWDVVTFAGRAITEFVSAIRSMIAGVVAMGSSVGGALNRMGLPVWTRSIYSAMEMLATIGPRLRDFFEPIRVAFWGIVTEVGSALVEFTAAVSEIIGTLAEMLPSVAGILGAVGIKITSWGQAVAGVFTWLRDQIVGILDGIAFTLRNWGGIFDIVLITIKEKIINLGQIFGWLQASAATVLDWFATNWRTIFIDSFEAVTTALVNLGENFRKFGKSFYDWLMSGFQQPFDFKATPLGAGMVAMRTPAPVLPALPDMTNLDAERQAVADRIGRQEGERDAKARMAALQAGGLGGDAMDEFLDIYRMLDEYAMDQMGPREKRAAGAGGGLDLPRAAGKPELTGLKEFANKVQLAAFGGKDKQLDILADQLKEQRDHNKKLGEVQTAIQNRSFPGVVV